jgi:hypothetical protein
MNDRTRDLLRCIDRKADTEGMVALSKLIGPAYDVRDASIPRELKLEGSTHADCLIECEESFVWIEGKRNDWLSPSTKWDVTRDQLARNIEAAWRLAGQAGKDFWLLICYEDHLKHHEQELVDGYRAGSWKAGLPHLSEETRFLFRQKIGTVRWQTIFRRWPALGPHCNDADAWPEKEAL